MWRRFICNRGIYWNVNESRRIDYWKSDVYNKLSFSETFFCCGFGGKHAARMFLKIRLEHSVKEDYGNNQRKRSIIWLVIIVVILALPSTLA